MVCMRCFRLATLLIPLLAAPALAAEAIPSPEGPLTDSGAPAVESITLPPQEQITEPDTVESLLTALKRQRDPDKAQQTANRLMRLWNVSGSATVDLLMQWADKAISEDREPAALDFLGQAISLDPGFVGAWNKRATLHFAHGDYAKSMSDINQVLKLEPHHFGALAGLAAILDASGREETSLSAWQSYLDIYPADRKAQDTVTKLSEKLAGSRL
ncbi:tetratricopeptide repeat protein [Rhizobium halophytocola]|uniref:tetratricopeptide repeat protein n=1 Tax=Rhizobium halophytocola TaxID=735519 RepID=UPI001AE538AF|nr:hypothetical protein [Rhizobium halophytocola]